MRKAKISYSSRQEVEAADQEEMLAADTNRQSPSEDEQQYERELRPLQELATYLAAKFHANQSKKHYSQSYSSSSKSKSTTSNPSRNHNSSISGCIYQHKREVIYLLKLYGWDTFPYSCPHSLRFSGKTVLVPPWITEQAKVDGTIIPLPSYLNKQIFLDREQQLYKFHFDLFDEMYDEEELHWYLHHGDGINKTKNYWLMKTKKKEQEQKKRIKEEKDDEQIEQAGEVAGEALESEEKSIPINQLDDSSQVGNLPPAAPSAAPLADTSLQKKKKKKKKRAALLLEVEQDRLVNNNNHSNGNNVDHDDHLLLSQSSSSSIKRRKYTIEGIPPTDSNSNQDQEKSIRLPSTKINYIHTAYALVVSLQINILT